MPREALQSPKTELLQIASQELADEGDRTSAPDPAKKRKADPYGGHRQHLFESELTQLLNKVKQDKGKHAYRNWLMLYLAYRHGLRREEIGLLRWVDVNFDQGEIYIHRMKGSKSNTHPLDGQELRGLRKVKREYPAAPFIFAGYGGKGISGKAVSKVFKAVAVAIALPDELSHPHVLRHTRGYLMVEKGYPLRVIQEWLGHKQIQHTVRYTALSAAQFRDVVD
jgi:type 1 fimbriae regulatory protein FimB/type 1 fimbriae regulatory protein FimE